MPDSQRWLSCAPTMGGSLVGHTSHCCLPDTPSCHTGGPRPLVLRPQEAASDNLVMCPQSSFHLGGLGSRYFWTHVSLLTLAKTNPWPKVAHFIWGTMAFFTEKWMESAQGPSLGECERPYSPGNESIQLGSVSGTKTTTIVVTATLVLC